MRVGTRKGGRRKEGVTTRIRTARSPRTLVPLSMEGWVGISGWPQTDFMTSHSGGWPMETRVACLNRGRFSSTSDHTIKARDLAYEASRLACLSKRMKESQGMCHWHNQTSQESSTDPLCALCPKSGSLTVREEEGSVCTKANRYIQTICPTQSLCCR